MKKILGFLVLFGVVSNVSAFSFKDAIEKSYLGKDKIAPVCSTRTLAMFDIYVVGGSTTATATCTVWASSMVFVTTDGLLPGTTYVMLNDADKDTIGELITFLNAVSSNTIGVEGGIVVTLRDGVYGGNPSSSMTVRGSIDVNTSTNTKTLYTDAIIGVTYTIPATVNKRNFLTYCNANMTFASGSTYISVFDGADNTDTTLLDKTKITTSAVNYSLPIYGEGSYIMGSKNTAMHIQIVNEDGTAISANILNIRSVVR